MHHACIVWQPVHALLLLADLGDLLGSHCSRTKQSSSLSGKVKLVTSRFWESTVAAVTCSFMSEPCHKQHMWGPSSLVSNVHRGR